MNPAATPSCPPTSAQCCHLRITGRVQGVYYRASMTEQASQRGLAGWVRNRLDGSVEAVVSGPPSEVEALIRWAERGPQQARVDGVQVSAWAGELPSGGFRQRETA